MRPFLCQHALRQTTFLCPTTKTTASNNAKVTSIPTRQHCEFNANICIFNTKLNFIRSISSSSTTTTNEDPISNNDDDDDDDDDNDETSNPSALRKRRDWRNLQDQRAFFDDLAHKLNVKSFEDWYNVDADHVRRLGGAGLLRTRYNDSLLAALRSIYPEHEFLPWKFRGVPKRFWRSMENQRQFFDWAAKQLGIRSDHQEEDWYRITTKQVRDLGGNSLLVDYYQKSLMNALVAVYPEIDWKPWKFKGCRLSKKFATAATNVIEFNNNNNNSNNNNNNSSSSSSSFVAVDSSSSSSSSSNTLVLKKYFEEFLAPQLRIGHLDDWYRVSLDQIRALVPASNGTNAFLRRNNGGLIEALRRVYPNHNWDPNRFHSSRGKKSSQRWLRATLYKLFPNQEILEDHLHPRMQFSDSGEHMELDVYIPSLRIAFEYHGTQHYNDVAFFGGQKRYYLDHDKEKIAACRAEGIALIPVPYWWDGRPESLAATVLEARPDLLPLLPADVVAAATAEGARPIPTTHPKSIAHAHAHTPTPDN